MKTATRDAARISALLMGSALVTSRVAQAVAQKQGVTPFVGRRLARARTVSPRPPKAVSQPRDFVLFRARSGKPKLIVRVDAQIYSPGVSYRQFLRVGAARTPEELAARRLQLLEGSLSGLAAYRALFQPNGNPAETPEELKHQFLAQQPHSHRKKDYTFFKRYDIGDYSWLISTPVKYEAQDYPELRKRLGNSASFSFPLLETMRRVGTRTYLTNDLAPPPSNALMVHLIGFESYPLPVRDTSSPYSVRHLDDSHKGKVRASNPHPVDILFDGCFLNVALDGKTPVTNAAARFVQDAVNVFKSRNKRAILRLWSAASARELAPQLRAGRVEWSEYSDVEGALENPGSRIAFVMDLGQDAIVFLRQPYQYPSFIALRLHGESGGYKFFLSQSLGVNPLATLNFENFLSSMRFKEFLVHGFRTQTQPKKPVPGGAAR